MVSSPILPEIIVIITAPLVPICIVHYFDSESLPAITITYTIRGALLAAIACLTLSMP